MLVLLDFLHRHIGQLPDKDHHSEVLRNKKVTLSFISVSDGKISGKSSRRRDKNMLEDMLKMLLMGC